MRSRKLADGRAEMKNGTRMIRHWLGDIASLRWVEPAGVAVWCAGVLVFMLAPLVVTVGASFHGGSEYAVVVFPPENLSLQWYERIPGAHYQAFFLSIFLAALTALISCLLGVPAALGLVRGNLPGKQVISAIFRAPLQIPAVVIGVAFMQLFYAVGNQTGWYAVGTFWGLLIGHVFHATPYVIGTTTAVLQRFNANLEEAALIHGASPMRVFVRVTLPLIMPGVYAGGLYAFMMSFGDVPISMFLTSSSFLTYPIELFFGMENDFDPSILASSSLVIVFSLLFMLVVQKIVGLDVLLKSNNVN